MFTKTIYHHLTPQTYMRAWKHGNSSVYVVDKGAEDVGASKNTKKFGGIENYHSFRVGSPALTEEDCKEIFRPLENYTVQINNSAISSLIEMNKEFYRFDEWTIIDNHKNIINELEKEILKTEISSIHLRDIEVGWDKKYENYWNDINQHISQEVFLNPNAQTLPAIKKHELIKFMVSLEWRTKPYHPVLLETLDMVMSKDFLGIDFKTMIIDEKKRLYPFLETAFDEFAHSYILKLYREFLNDSGIIMDEAKEFIDNFRVVLLIAPNEKEFITSDNPVCRITNQEGKVEYIFPINPKISCQIVRGSNPEEYLLRKLTKKDVININNKLKVNCNKGYILREQNRLLYF